MGWLVRDSVTLDVSKETRLEEGKRLCRWLKKRKKKDDAVVIENWCVGEEKECPSPATDMHILSSEEGCIFAKAFGLF